MKLRRGPGVLRILDRSSSWEILALLISQWSCILLLSLRSTKVTFALALDGSSVLFYLESAFPNTLGTERQHEGALDNIFSLSPPLSEWTEVCVSYLHSTLPCLTWIGQKSLLCFQTWFPQWKRTGVVFSGSGGQHSIFRRPAGKQHVLQHPVQPEEEQSSSTSTSKGTDDWFALVLFTFNLKINLYSRIC